MHVIQKRRTCVYTVSKYIHFSLPLLVDPLHPNSTAERGSLFTNGEVVRGLNPT